MKTTICPISNTPFTCNDCDWVDDTGKCLYMKLDDFWEDAFKVMRKKIGIEVKAKYEKG